MKSNCFLLITIYLLIVTLSPDLFAQEDELQRANELNKKVIQLYQQGQYEKAIPIAQDALRLREHTLGPDHPMLLPVSIIWQSYIELWALILRPSRYISEHWRFEKNNWTLTILMLPPVLII